jgi:hypothetical protein
MQVPQCAYVFFGLNHSALMNKDKIFERLFQGIVFAKEKIQYLHPIGKI